MAIAFLAHILLQKMLPVTPDDMGQVHEYLKGLFAQNQLMTDLCLKPWMWGNGAIVSMPRLPLRTPSMSALSQSDSTDQCPLDSGSHVIGCDHAESVSMHSRETACANTNKRPCDLMLFFAEDQSDPNSDKRQTRALFSGHADASTSVNRTKVDAPAGLVVSPVPACDSQRESGPLPFKLPVPNEGSVLHEPAELTEEPAVTSEELLTNGILCQFVDHAPHDLPTTSDRESGPLPSKLPVVLDGSLVHDCMHGARPNVGTIGQTSRDTPCGHLDMQAGLSTFSDVASCSSTSYDVPCANPQSTDARESGPLPFKLPVDTDVKTELWVTDAGTLPVPALPLPTGGGAETASPSPMICHCLGSAAATSISPGPAPPDGLLGVPLGIEPNATGGKNTKHGRVGHSDDDRTHVGLPAEELSPTNWDQRELQDSSESQSCIARTCWGLDLWDFANCVDHCSARGCRESGPLPSILPEYRLPARSGEVHAVTDHFTGLVGLDAAIGRRLSCMTYDQLKYSLDPNPLTEEQCQPTRESVVSRLQRVTILRLQEDMWADDEVMWHLHQVACVYQRLTASSCHVLDPLLATGWFNHGVAFPVTLPDQTPTSCLLTAIKFNCHWIPLILVKAGSMLNVHTWTWHGRHRNATHKLLQHLTRQIGCVDYRWINFEPRRFADDACGPMAVALAGHVLLGVPLPSGHSAVNAFADIRRKRFIMNLADQCLTPWSWASGVSEQAANEFKPFLIEHGVPAEQALNRAQAAVKAIGGSQILGALASKIPWKSLKTLGNQVKFKFLLPAELQSKIQNNAGGSVGKPKGGRKSKTGTTDGGITLDPSKLKLPEGTFAAGVTMLQQIPLSAVGPIAEGVVLVSQQEAEPYLTQGRRVSNHPLALFVLQSAAEVDTSLAHTALTVPCRCLANNEPILVDGVLCQIGNGFVEKGQSMSQVAVDTVAVAALKFLVYKDEI